MGAIGMLTEQGGHSRGGRAVKTNDEYVLTLRQRVFDHYTTSFATITTAVERREDLLNYFRDFFVNSTNEAGAFLFPDDAANGSLYRMLKNSGCARCRNIQDDVEYVCEQRNRFLDRVCRACFHC